ncbi:MAG: adenylate/guanylate cyclase domain-containing protein [Deltaproteobacteria bacterium]|nr:adenylate/guanylate cyclase domain-containing protein [Deltaproteobacteria bacterium]MBW1871970.1 adenylate/guanylate cyclase domain-containing protein [Deltaproteobacteria bacterium]
MAYAGRIGTDASMDRLEKLIEKRLKPGADKEKIDERIWNLFGEQWAVMFTDLSGFSRQVAEFGIIHFLQVIFESERLLIPCIDDHDGVLLKLEGDSMLVMFRSVAKALECSVAMQRILAEYNTSRSDTEKIIVCIGLGFGPVLRIGNEDIFGAEVNAASKLGEDTAGPREILVTDNVRKELHALKDYNFTQIDEVPPGADSAYKVEYKL